MLKKFFAVPNHSLQVDFGILFVRLVMGIAFILHGYGKIQNPFGWAQGAPIPGFLQGLAALAEFGGGIALVLGLLTPLACLGLICTMLVATCMHAFVLNDPFVAQGPGAGSYEPALNYLALSVLIFLIGPGRHSADKAIFKSK